MKRFNYLLFICAVTIYGCDGGGWKTTASGLRFRVVTNDPALHNTEPIRIGATVKIYLTRRFKDSIVYTNEGSMPQYVTLIPGLMTPYGPAEALLYGVHEGDSLLLEERADSLLAKGLIQRPLRAGVSEKDSWISSVKVVRVFQQDMLHPMRSDSLLAADKRHEKQRLDQYFSVAGPKAVHAYLQAHRINSNPEIIAGNRVNSCDTARRIIGLHLSGLDGKQVYLRKDSVPYHPGMAGLLKSVDTSLCHFAPGAHLRYYLAPMDAFGSEPPAGIPPYTAMIFDIVVKK